MSDTDPRRYTITVTPMTPDELAGWIGALRERHGRKHLVHVIAEQPSGTHLDDAPREPDALAEQFRTACLETVESLTPVGYPARFAQGIRRRSGEQTVEFVTGLILGAPAEGAPGYRRLVRAGRADDTLEAAVLREQWAPLFAADVAEVARWRLTMDDVEAVPST